MKTLKAVGMVVCVATGLWSGSVNAQVDPLSDVLYETVLGNGLPINDPQTFQIFESMETGQPFTFTVPQLVINFLESGSPNVVLSDRFIFRPYDVTITSDAEGPLPFRPGAIQGPEQLRLLSIQAVSDGEDSAGSLSDVLRVGFFGLPVHEFFLPEGADPGSEIVHFVTDPVHYDLLEPGGSGVSDYVDIGSIDITFISSDNPSDYSPDDPENASIPEFPGATGLDYGLHFESDTDVPEPSSLTLFVGGLGVLCVRQWRKRRAQV